MKFKFIIVWGRFNTTFCFMWLVCITATQKHFNATSASSSHPSELAQFPSYSSLPIFVLDCLLVFLYRLSLEFDVAKTLQREFKSTRLIRSLPKLFLASDVRTWLPSCVSVRLRVEFDWFHDLACEWRTCWRSAGDVNSGVARISCALCGFRVDPKATSGGPAEYQPSLFSWGGCRASYCCPSIPWSWSWVCTKNRACAACPFRETRPRSRRAFSLPSLVRANRSDLSVELWLAPFLA